MSMNVYESICVFGGFVNITSLLEDNLAAPKILNVYMSFDPVISLLGILYIFCKLFAVIKIKIAKSSPISD